MYFIFCSYYYKIQIHLALYIKQFYVWLLYKIKIDTDSVIILKKKTFFAIEMIRLCTNIIHNLGHLVSTFVHLSIQLCFSVRSL